MNAVELLRYWKSQIDPDAWRCWSPSTCEEARADGEPGSCPSCLVDAFLLGVPDPTSEDQ